MTQSTRSEYVRWCKQRALEYLDAGQHEDAVTSMLSDLGKHPETKIMLEWAAPMGLNAILQGPDAARRFVEEFTE